MIEDMSMSRIDEDKGMGGGGWKLWIPLYSIEFEEFKPENSDEDSKVIMPSEGYSEPSDPGVPIEFTEGLCPSDTSSDIFDEGTEDGPAEDGRWEVESVCYLEYDGCSSFRDNPGNMCKFKKHIGVLLACHHNQY
jgi:hypothetical protein